MSLILTESQSGGGTPVITLVAGENISAFQCVAVRADGLAYKASASDVSDVGRVVGIAITSALTGGNVSVMNDGEISNNGFGFIAGKTVFLGLDGAVAQIPSVGVFDQPLGTALSSSEVDVQIGLAILFA